MTDAPNSSSDDETENASDAVLPVGDYNSNIFEHFADEDDTSLEEETHQLGSPAQEPSNKRSSLSSTDVKESAVKMRLKGIKPKDIVAKRESIPGYKKVVTLPKGDFPLTEEQMKHYVALLLNEKHRTILILHSIEAPKTGMVDQQLLSLRERIKRKGYKNIELQPATSPVIEIIYDQAAEAEASDEDEAAQTSELSNDYDELLREAVEGTISDLHIEVRRSSAIVRSRKHGSLTQRYDWTVQYARRLASVIYQVIAEEKDITFKESEPQNAIVDRDLGQQRIRVRLQTIPAYPDGFDMVMRILPMGVESGKEDSLETLGYEKHHTQKLNIATARPTGVTVLAGVTGSGKSTSLKTLIQNRISHYLGAIKVITVEDPPEYEITGSTQVPVVRSRAKDGINPFAESIKAAMRADPDILMVGEVRDSDSAELLVSAVQSGHQAFTTVHAASGIGIIGRFRSLKIPNAVLGSPDFLSGLCYQTLVPVLCKHCSIPIGRYVKRKDNQNERHEELLTRLRDAVKKQSDQQKIRFKNSVGCEHCTEGIAGRTVCAEVIIPDSKMLSLFSNNQDIEAVEYFVSKGGKTALDAGIGKMKTGLCDPFDVESKLGLLNNRLNNELVV